MDVTKTTDANHPLATPPVDTSNANPNQLAADQETFLKLLVAQLAQQDPLDPMEGTEFVTQLAQFSAVEQAIAQSQQLDLLSAQVGGLANNAAADLVGKTVTVRGNSVAFDGSNPVSSTAKLDKDAETVTVTIRDAGGAAVKTMELGPQSKGNVSIEWDGKGENGKPLPPGQYTVEVHAEDADGGAVTATQDVSGVVVGISYEKGYAELLLDTGAKAAIGDLVSVGQTSVKSTPSTANNNNTNNFPSATNGL